MPPRTLYVPAGKIELHARAVLIQRLARRLAY
jgi:hypothetical protein